LHALLCLRRVYSGAMARCSFTCVLVIIGLAALATATGIDEAQKSSTGAAPAAPAPPVKESSASGGSNLRGASNDTIVEAETAARHACVGQPGWNTNFGQHMFQCGMQTFGMMPAAGSCMAQLQHVSAACGKCLGQLISCGKQCLSQCCAGQCREKPACAQCSATHCNPAFVACAGVSPP